MNDDNFDKIFGDKLKAGKDFPFSEAKWQKMENHLDTYLAERQQKRRWVLLAIPMFALFGLLGVGGLTVYQAQRNIQDLTAEVKALRMENSVMRGTPSVKTEVEAPQHVTKTDTVYRHVVITRYNTVLKTFTGKREWADRGERQPDATKSPNYGKVESATIDNALKPKLAMGEKAQNQDNSTAQGANVLGNALTIATKEDSTTGNNTALIEKNNVKEDEIKANILAKIDSLNKKADKIIEVFTASLNKIDDEQGKKPMPIIRPIKPSRYEIGVSKGLAFLTGRNILKQDGNSIGGRVGLLLNEHFKIVAEAQYLALNYSVDKIQETNDIPTINPPTRNDVFLQVKVKQPYWHYALGMEYAIGHQRFKPYVGLSVFGQTKLEEQFEYKFISLRRRNDVFVYTDRNDNSFQKTFLRLRTGVEFPIYKQIKAQVEGSFDIKTRNLPQFQPLWQLKGSVLYRF